jgi:hypothetical protein
LPTACFAQVGNCKLITELNTGSYSSQVQLVACSGADGKPVRLVTKTVFDGNSGSSAQWLASEHEERILRRLKQLLLQQKPAACQHFVQLDQVRTGQCWRQLGLSACGEDLVPTAEQHRAAVGSDAEHELWVVEVLRQLCTAIEKLSDLQLVHNDLNSSNVVIRPEAGGSFTVALIDFGSAASNGERQLLSPSPRGSFLYAPPECFNPNRPHQPSVLTDVWGVGVLAVQLLTGERPWQQFTGPPVALDQQVKACLLDIGARPQYDPTMFCSSHAAVFLDKSLAYSLQRRAFPTELLGVLDAWEEELDGLDA